ncbi:hypothetical protein A3768_4795 (plasmid) [Ralstonia solanacearum]|nr:hypothetical protein A3768_4795 [Ralstonia solanacearum]
MGTPPICRRLRPDCVADSCSAFQFNLKPTLNHRAFIPYHWTLVYQALE